MNVCRSFTRCFLFACLNLVAYGGDSLILLDRSQNHSEPDFCLVERGDSLTLMVADPRLEIERYTWRYNGGIILGATGASLSLTDIDPSMEGFYTVVVEDLGSWRSAGLVFVGVERDNPAQVRFSNVGSRVNVPVFAPNGSTLGSDFVVALFAGPQPNLLRLTGLPVGFLPSNPEYFAESSSKKINSVTPLDPAYVRIAIWNQNDSTSFAEAVSTGGDWYISNLFVAETGGLLVGGPPVPPPGFHGLRRFYYRGEGTPEILSQPQNRVVRLGQSTVLSVSLDPTASHAGYQWYRDGVIIHGATGPELMIDPASVADAARYWARIQTDEDLLVTDSTSVVVTAPDIATEGLPAISNHPHGHRLNPGSSVLLSVRAASTSLLSYQWWFNGQPIPDAVSPELLITDFSSLEVGTYHVVVSNESGAVSSQSAELVLGDPDATVSIGSDAELRMTSIGGSIELSVEISSAHPGRMQWYFNGAAIPGATSSSLHIENATREHQGYYTLESRSDGGSVRSRPIYLGVSNHTSYLHVTYVGDSRLTYSDGSSVEGNVAVQVLAGPTAEQLQPVGGPLFVSWSEGAFVGGNVPLPTVPMSEVGHIVVRAWDLSLSATFEDAVQNDAEWWVSTQFRASHASIISANRSVQFFRKGHGKLRVSTGFGEDATLKLGESIRLNVEAHGPEPYSYQWFKDGAPIINAEDQTLAIDHPGFSDAGNYWVVVENDSDVSASHVVNVAVRVPPEGVFTEAPKIVDDQIQVGFIGRIGAAFVVEYSENMVDWIPVETFTNVSGSDTISVPLNRERPGIFLRTRRLD